LNILISQTQEAAIVYFELKKQLEKEIDNLLNEYRKRCIIAYCEVYLEYKNKISFDKFYPRFLFCNIDVNSKLYSVNYDINKLTEEINKLNINWICQYSVSVFSTYTQQYRNSIRIDFEDDEVIFDLNKTDLFDENVMNQEVEKFKQNTKRIFDYKLTEEQRIIRQKIAELQAKLI
jgi:hypothetical protein